MALSDFQRVRAANRTQIVNDLESQAATELACTQVDCGYHAHHEMNARRLRGFKNQVETLVGSVAVLRDSRRVVTAMHQSDVYDLPDLERALAAGHLTIDEEGAMTWNEPDPPPAEEED